MGVGMPHALYLEEWAQKVHAAFPGCLGIFHVGSSLRRKRGWRDVDVRLMLHDEEYNTLFGDPIYAHGNQRWVSLCMAYSALGRQMTGLPIDFQIQQMTQANEEHGDRKLHPRSALGVWDNMDTHEMLKQRKASA